MSRLRAAGSLICVVLALGCTDTHQAKDVHTSGFLGDAYPKLHKGHEGEALLVYRHPNAKPESAAAYKKILLDPVTVWRDSDTRLKGIPFEDMQRLADNFYNLIYMTLSEDYEMVAKPGPHTMRIQVALTDADASMPVMDVISTVVPQLRLISKGKEFATGKPAFVGEASVEAKITDSQTGVLLAAGVDRRVGSKTLNAESFNSWGDVNQTLEYWAKLAKFRLCEARAGTNCAKPKE